MKRFAAFTGAALSALLATCALAGDVNCNAPPYSGRIPGGEVIDGNLVVPNGSTCLAGSSLGAGVDLTSNVRVGRNASFTLIGNSTIFGNLEASNCAYVELNYGAEWTTVVGGNVWIRNCRGMDNPYFTGEAFGSHGPNNRIIGNAECWNNTGACVLISAFVGGNVQYKRNASVFASQVMDDTINGKLLCRGNSPTPTGSGSDTVVGNGGKSSEGQCPSPPFP
jgi:hypothetical protein